MDSAAAAASSSAAAAASSSAAAAASSSSAAASSSSAAAASLSAAAAASSSAAALKRIVDEQAAWLAGASDAHRTKFSGPPGIDAARVQHAIGLLTADKEKQNAFLALHQSRGVALNAVAALRRAFPLASKAWAVAHLNNIVYAR